MLTISHPLSFSRHPVSHILILQRMLPIAYPTGTMKVKRLNSAVTVYTTRSEQLTVVLMFLDNNQLKRNLYQDLNNYWKRAIQSSVAKLRDGETYSAQTVAEWAKW